MPPYAPACALATRALTRAERVRVRARANTTRFTMLSTGPFAPFWCMEVAADAQSVSAVGGLNSGPRRRRSWRPIRWPRRALLGAFTGLLGALLSLCGLCDCAARCWRACDACFHCTKPQCCACIQVPSVWHGLGLRVWHSLCRARPKRMA